jgi:leucyl aminopeptidase
MKVAFVSAPSSRLVARIANQDQLPAGLEPVLVEGAKASRFTGKPGQLFEGFADRGGAVTRAAIAGAGEAGSKDRLANLEKAGAALSAKYGASGETVLAIDLGDAGLSAVEAAAVLLGARLRGWRYDLYRTKLPEDQKQTLTTIEVLGAPDGTEATWAAEAALADGVEFTRELVTEPARAARRAMPAPGLSSRCSTRSSSPRSAWARCSVWRRVRSARRGSSRCAGTAASQATSPPPSSARG